jgi:hypothetical protein
MCLSGCSLYILQRSPISIKFSIVVEHYSADIVDARNIDRNLIKTQKKKIPAYWLENLSS